MAESIIIHCRQRDADELVRRIEARFVRVSESKWRFPADDYLLSVSSYTDFASEYELTEKQEMITKLGEEPTVAFDFEIRRSRSDEACDVLESFVRADLSDIEFLVDDMSRILSRGELVGVDDFLDVYRYKKQEAEQGVAPQSATRSEFDFPA